jgi:hypothetical protein
MRAIVLILCCLSSLAHAQNDTSVFTKQKEVSTSEYVLMIPEQWKNIPGIDISSKDRKYSFSGIGLPEEFNHVPVSANLSLRRYECNKIAVAEDYIISEMTSYPDRVTPPGENYKTDTLTIKSGETGALYSTRFFRHTKVYNFSRFDLIVYSPKRKAAYMFTIVFQYRDPTYAFEKDNNLRQYALRFFSNILLR